MCKAAVNHHSEIQAALVKDEFANAVVDTIRAGSKRLTGKYSKSVSLGECTFDSQSGLMYVYGLLCVPNNESLYPTILHVHHHNPAAGHPSRAATYELVSRNYWWPGMRKTIARYLNNCDTCARIKPSRHALYGLLKPLQVPVVRWSSVSMDFITGLPESKPPGSKTSGISNSSSNTRGFNAILVVVDWLTKMAHYIPTREDTNSEQVARLYFDNIFRLHGLPDSIISDRGTQFTSVFSQTLCKLVVITQNHSTSFHPQTDDQTERVNAILEQYLRGYINY